MEMGVMPLGFQLNSEKSDEKRGAVSTWKAAESYGRAVPKYDRVTE